MATMDNKLHDDELYDLFSSFDDVSASDDLKATTLDCIEETRASMAFTAVTGGAQKKPAKRSKWRVMKVAAVAACLTLALTGGAAYALPASHVTLSQDGSSVELGVNRFGITVSASSEDEAGREVVESVELRNVPYEEALERALDYMEERNPGLVVGFDVESGDEGMKQELENEGHALIAQRELDSEIATDMGVEPSSNPVPEAYSANENTLPPGESLPNPSEEPRSDGAAVVADAGQAPDDDHSSARG